MFWALFVIGHDCGHGSFSRYKGLNHLVGHITHTFILVPYHSWRISHRTHHSNTGNIETDESWYPIVESPLSPDGVSRERGPLLRQFAGLPNLSVHAVSWSARFPFQSQQSVIQTV